MENLLTGEVGDKRLVMHGRDVGKELKHLSMVGTGRVCEPGKIS